MRDYKLSIKEITELERLHRSLRDKRQADRVKAVIALSRGWSAAQIAEILLFDEKTSRQYFDRYQQGGIQMLPDDNYSGAAAKLNEHQMSELEVYLEEHLLPDADVIYIIVDNARYYHSRLLKEYAEGTKIKLIFLPPYSPNLNLIERYWKFFKKKILNNQYYETFEEFKPACKSFFRKRKKYLPELQTLLSENFHIQAA